MTLLSIQSDGVGRVTEVILNLVLINLDVVYEEQRVDDGQEDCFDVDLDFLGKRNRSFKITNLLSCQFEAADGEGKEYGGKHEVDCDGGKAVWEIYQSCESTNSSQD